MKENDLQKQILDYLKEAQIYHLRLNSGKIRVGSKYVQLCPEGTPDLQLIINSKPIFLEVKASELRKKEWHRKVEAWKKTAYLNDFNRREVMQYKMMEKIREAGAEAYVIASLDEAINIINSL